MEVSQFYVVLFCAALLIGELRAQTSESDLDTVILGKI